MTRIGILGAAQIAPTAMIGPVSRRQDCQIVALACREADRGLAFAAMHGIPHVETDYQAMVERSDVDLIYNALPPSRHADMSIAALNAGKAVLCEKPFAMNAGEATRMNDAADRTGGTLIEAFHYRHHPAFHRLLSLVRSGEIGKLREIHAVFVAPVPYQPGEVRHTLSIGGGSLMDMGCYPVHWIRTLVGTEPVVRQASSIVSQPQIDKTTCAELEFECGTIAKIECSMDDSRQFQAELAIKGSKGEVHMENPLSPHKGHSIRIAVGGIESEHKVSGLQTYDYQLSHVLDVMHGSPPSYLGSLDSVANMKVIDSIYQAAGLRER